MQDWLLIPGLVDGRAAALVRDPADPSASPRYFALLTWDAGKGTGIRDFRFARYAAEGAELSVLGE